MEDLELKQIWQSYQNKIEAVVDTNTTVIQNQKKQDVKHSLATIYLSKFIGIVLGLAWVIIVANTAIAHINNFAFAISLAIIAIISLISISLYIKHLVFIIQINYDESVLTMQEKLAKLQLSQLDTVRFAFLQLPFYFTWYINKKMFDGSQLIVGLLQIALIACSIIVTIWLFNNFKLKNKDKSWFKAFIKSSGWNKGNKAISLLDEINNFKID